jgi:hypothetical protein
MNQILQQLKSVRGVSGILVLDKQNSTTYQLLPASFSLEVIKNLAGRLRKIAQVWPELGQVELKFESGYGKLINTPSSAVYISTKEEVFFPDLNLVLKSVLPQIEKRISRGHIFAEAQADQLYSPDKVNIDLLLATINLIAAKYRDRLGAYQITQNLRRSKEKILSLFPHLSNFYVDNQGRVAFLKSRQELNQSRIQEAFANWIYHFKIYCDSITASLQEADIQELTSELRSELTRQGFYHWYEMLTVA